ncbi:MAG TPA: hypothetical protein VK281_02215 [Xanthobacteraceae bacterium]|nr:hypothetical protein [Xanthobacteraceae bacterium]
MIGPVPAQRAAARFWVAVISTGPGTRLGAAALTGPLEWMQHRRGPAAESTGSTPPCGPRPGGTSSC